MQTYIQTDTQTIITEKSTKRTKISLCLTEIQSEGDLGELK